MWGVGGGGSWNLEHCSFNPSSGRLLLVHMSPHLVEPDWVAAVACCPPPLIMKPICKWHIILHINHSGLLNKILWILFLFYFQAVFLSTPRGFCNKLSSTKSEQCLTTTTIYYTFSNKVVINYEVLRFELYYKMTYSVVIMLKYSELLWIVHTLLLTSYIYVNNYRQWHQEEP